MIIDINNFNLENRNEIKDEKGEIQYWSQKDFAYKRRVHIYDNSNNEIGYVQYKVLSIQTGIEFYDKTDKQIDMSEFTVSNRTSKWNYEIIKNGNCICKINDGKIEVVDNLDIEKCILFIFSQAEEGE